MRVYLACAMTNPHREVGAVESVLQMLVEEGHHVLTPHVVDTPERSQDRFLTNAEVAQRDLLFIAQADCLVAEVSTPSHGVGIEVMAAVSAAKPVLALAHVHARVSRLLAGLPGLRLERYGTREEAVEIVRRFLASVAGKP